MHLLAASVNTNTLKFEGGRTMPSSIREMLAEANAAVPRLNPAEVRDMIVLIVDVRDAPELAAGGKLKGAVNASRGMLEFRADPESPYYNPAFHKDKTVLVYCGSGGRAALSGKTLRTSATSRSTTPAGSRS